jgi:hypothetical protein
MEGGVFQTNHRGRAVPPPFPLDDSRCAIYALIMKNKLLIVVVMAITITSHLFIYHAGVRQGQSEFRLESKVEIYQTEETSGNRERQVKF